MKQTHWRDTSRVLRGHKRNDDQTHTYTYIMVHYDTAYEGVIDFAWHYLPNLVEAGPVRAT